ncbi:MAG: hypothetical protein KJT01_07855 [Gemmatimonadetes bacterium]|nr:hypothetical protein [Gemmatimonadota bacterium]
MASRARSASNRRGALLVELLAALAVVAVIGTLGLHLAGQQLLLHDRALALDRAILTVDAGVETRRNRPCAAALPPLPAPPLGTRVVAEVAAVPQGPATLAVVRTTLQWTPRHGTAARPMLEADAQVMCW